MFHCNGWCFPWTIAASAGVNVCLRKVDPAKIFELIKVHGVTHMCGAPIVMATLLNAPDAEKRPLPHRVEFVTAGAPPPEAVLARMGVRVPEPWLAKARQQNAYPPGLPLESVAQSVAEAAAPNPASPPAS